MIKIAIVDDTKLLATMMSNTINAMDGFRVVLQAGNGKDFIDKLYPHDLPDLVFLDISMPVMDGYDTAAWIIKRYPEMKIVILTSLDTDDTFIRLINIGVKGYVLKDDTSPSELGGAMQTVLKGEYYLPGGKLGKLVNNKVPEITPREIEFLRHLCKGLTYREIAGEMRCAKRTVDGYRDNLFTKLGADNRTQLALYAVKNGIFRL